MECPGFRIKFVLIAAVTALLHDSQWVNDVLDEQPM